MNIEVMIPFVLPETAILRWKRWEIFERFYFSEARQVAGSTVSLFNQYRLMYKLYYAKTVLNLLPRHPGTAPGPLEVVTPQPTGDVYYFADKV